MFSNFLFRIFFDLINFLYDQLEIPTFLGDFETNFGRSDLFLEVFRSTRFCTKLVPGLSMYNKAIPIVTFGGLDQSNRPPHDTHCGVRQQLGRWGRPSP